MRQPCYTKTPSEVTGRRKQDSFHGSRSFVLPAKQYNKILSNPSIKDLYLTDIGFYPHAKGHFRRRVPGIDEHILIYCIDGEGAIRVDNKTYPLEANSYFVIPAHETHCYWASEEMPWSIYWVHYGGERSLYFNNFYGKTHHLQPSTNSRLDERLRLFDEILTALEIGFSNENLVYANLCLNRLLASFFYVETYRKVRGYRTYDPVDEAIFFIQENLDKTLKVKEIADQVNLSESHFTRIFRNKTGASPLEYFINLKMQEAVRLLMHKSLRIKEVACILGYDDTSYFTRIFTKRFGTSPGAYIKTTRK